MFGKLKLLLYLIYTKFKIVGIKSIGNKVIVVPTLTLLGKDKIKIGSSCYFGPNCRIEAWTKYNDKFYDPVIDIGEDVRINSTCHIGAINKVIIGKQTLLGSHVMIIDHSHGSNSIEELSMHPSERDLYSKGPIIIGERCWICENVTVLPNVTIGDECIIGANSVVTKDMPSRSVVVGNPAKIVRRIL